MPASVFACADLQSQKMAQIHPHTSMIDRVSWSCMSYLYQRTSVPVLTSLIKWMALINPLPVNKTKKDLADRFVERVETRFLEPPNILAWKNA